VTGMSQPAYIVNSTIDTNQCTNGGGIYSDGTSESVTVDGSLIQGNRAPEGGPGVFCVSNDRTGNLVIKSTRIIGNSGQSFFKVSHRSIYYLGNGPIQVSGSTVE